MKNRGHFDRAGRLVGATNGADDIGRRALSVDPVVRPAPALAFWRALAEAAGVRPP